MECIKFSNYRAASVFARQHAKRTEESVRVLAEGRFWIVEIEPRIPVQRPVPAPKDLPPPLGEKVKNLTVEQGERPCIGNSAQCQKFVPTKRVESHPHMYRCVPCQTKYELENPPPPPAEFAGNRDWHKRQRGWR